MIMYAHPVPAHPSKPILVLAALLMGPEQSVHQYVGNPLPLVVAALNGGLQDSSFPLA